MNQHMKTMGFLAGGENGNAAVLPQTTPLASCIALLSLNFFWETVEGITPLHNAFIVFLFLVSMHGHFQINSALLSCFNILCWCL